MRPILHCILGPYEVSILSGLYGTLHNNQLVDNPPESVDYKDTARSRMPTEDEAGILCCCSYTAHSQEAGKARRVTRGTRVRVLTQQLVYRLCRAESALRKEKADVRDRNRVCPLTKIDLKLDRLPAIGLP